jgi:ubiquinone/menaquinone biosynthesis C-methylase UbiE
VRPAGGAGIRAPPVYDPETMSPDHDLVLRRYRRHAAGYDASARRTMGLRARTVARLALAPGQTVLDVAAGTGLSIGLLREGVGESGRVIAVELCPEMLDLARRRVAAAGWRNVTLLQGAMEEVRLPAPLDAVLFNYTHDVLRSPPALANIFAALRPGGRVAAAGMRLLPWWLAPLNLYVLLAARPYMTTFEGLGRPWSLLESYLDGFATESTLLGTGYIGWGAAAGLTTGRRSPTDR